MNLLQCFLDLLYPPRCVFCHKVMDSSDVKVCRQCEKNLPYTVAVGQRQSLPFVSVCVSPLYYEGTVRESFLRYKFGGATGYASVYGDFIAKSIDENAITCDIITWTPLSRRRLRSRGYDQARMIAQRVAQLKGLQCRRLLNKTVNNPAQSGRGDAAKRRANVSGVYKAADTAGIEGKTILIIDDVVTTGSTLSECARVLKAAGAGKIVAATFARKRD